MFSLCSKSQYLRLLVQRLSRSLPHQSSETIIFAQFKTSAKENTGVELAYTAYPEFDQAVDPTKTPLIFSHGLYGVKENLHTIARKLSSESRKVITYDPRNHGDSMHSNEFNFPRLAQDLRYLIDDLGFMQPLLAGHSMGAKTAMTLALTEPEKVKAVIVEDTVPMESPINILLEYGKAMKAAEIPKDASLSFARKELKLHLYKYVQDEMILNFLIKNLKTAENGQVVWGVNLDPLIDNFDLITGFPDLEGRVFTKPALFMFGQKSEHYSSKGVESVKKYFPAAEIVVIQDASHVVHIDKPKEYLQAVLDFCARVDSS